MTHETSTEAFYSHGVENYGNFHDNYLNFGLWEDNITEFVNAAEHLLLRVGTKIGLDEKSHLLDVACGMGTQDRYFLKTFDCARIHAIDLTKKHITLAKSRNPSKRITYRVGNAVKLSYPEETFTHVTAIEGEVHFNTREKFFREAYRVLKPGGKIGLSDFCLARRPKNALEWAFVKACAKLWHIPFQNIDDPTSYGQKLTRSGYTNVHVERVGANVIPGYYHEQARPEVRSQMAKIRGFYAGRIGFFIDWFMFQLYKKGLLEYILVSGEKA